ncbi:RNA repair domain-containing protein [[Eubacterium] cellulosolvens]
MIPLKNIFNKIFWDKRVNIQDFEITYIHRGAPNDQKTIAASIITEVGKSWFTYKEGANENMIPMHRIIGIKNIKTGNFLWKKRNIVKDV